MPTTPMPPAAAAPPPPSAEDGDPFTGGDLPATGQDGRPEARLHWVFLDARTGRLACPGLGLERDRFTGRITGSRLVRVFGDGHGGLGEENSALCASENRRVADHGRPGRECGTCEERHASCTPRWRIVWEEPGSGLAFAHTLSASGTVQFTRYALALRREGLRPAEALTRFSTEGLCQPEAEARRWRLRFDRIGPQGK